VAEPQDPELLELTDALAERHGGVEWRVWRGTGGELFAWWKKRKPPLRFRGAAKDEVLAKVARYVATGKRPED
jgi:hypothetical protein